MPDRQNRATVRLSIVCLIASWTTVEGRSNDESAVIRSNIVRSDVGTPPDAAPLDEKGSDATPATPQPPPLPEGTKRVTYVPEIVKDELRKEIKEEVLDEAKKNNWAAPNVLPEWLKRIKFSGDIRLRYELDRMADGNAVDYYPDFNAINQGSPFDVNFRDPSSERWLNTNRRRSRLRLRARVAVEANIGQGFSTELRLASGDSPTPVSTNQNLGASGGNFSKYQFWLDRATLRYRLSTPDQRQRLAVMLGRFENLFFRTDLTWDENVNLDGAALQSDMVLGRDFRPFLAGGAFPIFNTAFDFPAERPDKFISIDKWLFAVQAGTEWKRYRQLGVKFGLSYYHFYRVQGVVGSDCDTNIKAITCDTDHSRPSFAQKGNTYRPLRTPSVAALDSELMDGASRYQYFGLSSKFQELVATARIEVLYRPNLFFGLEGEAVNNLGFHRNQITPDAVNNFKSCSASDSSCRDEPPYGGGNQGYLARVIVGTPNMSQRWDWNVTFAYRYLESDAIVDAFAQSEFALGGTNNKGFMGSLSVAIADNVIATLRSLSSTVVVGPKYSIDVVHVEMMARY